MIKSVVSVMLLWICVVGSTCWWNIGEQKSTDRRIAFETARAFFQLIVVTRAWNARNGGVYVPVTEDTRPNPYLEDSLKDLSTDKNIDLTMINPAYMTRQISEVAAQYGYGVQFHITSLKPIRPENSPTDWEATWLQSFETDKTEAGEFYADGSTVGFRYMAPLWVDDSCLKCHAKQGYKRGEVRGGISVTLPNVAERLNYVMLMGYGIAASLGFVLISIGGVLLHRKRELLVQANQALQTEIDIRQETITHLREANEQIKQMSGIIPICMHCKEIRDDKGYWNKLEKFISEHSEAQFSHSICEKCMEKYYPETE